MCYSHPCGWKKGRVTFGALLGVLIVVLLWAGETAAVSSELIGRPITRVDIECNARIDEKGLRELLPLRVGALLTDSMVEESRRLLQLKRIFDQIDVNALPKGDGVDVVIRLGRVLVVDTIGAQGYENLRRREVRRLLRVRPGAIYRRQEVAAAAERIRKHYVTLGFLDAKVSPIVEEDNGEVDITFDIEEGRPLIVQDAVIDGKGHWAEELVETLEDLRGERLTRDAERDATKTLIRHMRGLDYYDARVTSTWERTGEQEGVLRFAVDSGSLFAIQIVGNESKSRKKLLGLMDLADRLIITNGTWRELARRMIREYQDSRFYRVQIDVKIEHNGTKLVRFEVQEGRTYAIRSLRFDGNKRLPEDRLIDQMVTQPRRTLPWPHSGALIDQVLSEDVKRIEQFYRTHGFESAKAADVRRDVDEAEGNINLTIVVEEGPCTVVREMRPADVSQVVGADVVLQTRVGEPLSIDAVAKDRRAILFALAQRGYAEGSVEPSVERSGSGEVVDAVLEWHIEPQTRQEIGRVIIQGNVDTRDLAIQRELPFASGDPLDVGKLLDGQARLYRTGLFRSAGVEALDTADEAVRDVVVRVGERPAGTLDWGGGYNTRDGFGTFVEVGYRNLWGMARHVSLRGQITLKPKDFVPDQYLARLGYQAPYVSGTKWRYTGSLLAERATREVDKFSIERVDFLNGIDRELWPNVHGGMDVDMERADVFDVEPDAVLSGADEGLLTTVALGPFLVYDGRDNAFNPRAGRIDSMHWRYALPGISTVHFLKANLQHTQFISLFKDVLFLYSARIGWARALDGGDKQVPIRDRFFLGGRTTVRGFSENSISPEGENGNETGGDLAINLNVELEVPLIYGFGAALFVDGGGVYLQNCDRDCRQEKNLSDAAFSINNFRRSTGFGLRYNTPVGPIALDYGIKLDRKGGESFGEFHFSIGSTF